MSELNKQLLEAIKETPLYVLSDYKDYQKAANECERICLQAQINLLTILRKELHGKGQSTPEISENINQLEEQLKQLNK